MPDYAHPAPKRIPWWKRCKTKHSARWPARCKKARGHDGDHKFGWWPPAGIGGQRWNLDAELPPIIGAVAAGGE